MRGAQQPGDVSIWRQAVDGPDHDHMGLGRCRNCIGRRALQFLCGEADPGYRRGGFLSWRYLLSDAVVSGAVPHQGACVVHGGHTDFIPGRRATVHLALANAWLPWPRRLAMDVHHRRDAGLYSGADHAEGADQPPGRSQMADTRRA
ncbi:hypothetical protein D3C73_771630 [compost metagenome]